MKPAAGMPFRLTLGAALGLGLCAQPVLCKTGSADCVLSQSTARSPLGAAVAFSLNCPQPTSSVAWDFGDGRRIDTGAATATHVYLKEGHFLVVARAKGNPVLATIPHTAFPPLTSLRPTHASAIVYDSARQRIFVVNPDQNTVSALGIAARSLLWEKPVGKNPSTLALDASGQLWVVCRDAAALSVLDADDGRLLASVPLPYASRPYGIAFAPGTDRALVTLEATGRLLEIDAPTRRIVDSLDLGLHARALAVSADGRVLAARFLSPSDHGEIAEAARAPLSLRTGMILAMDQGPDNEAGSRGVPNALSDIAITPDGLRAWVASKKDNVKRGRFLEGLDLTFETSVRSITSQIDLAAGKEDPGRRKDYNDQALPSAVAFSRLGEYAFVAFAASNNIAVVDAWTGGNVFSLEPRNAESERAPEGLVLDGNDSLLFVHYFLSREVGIWDVSALGRDNSQVRHLASMPTAAREALAPDVVKGKRVFYNAADTRMSKDRYTSCVVCHMDGATDGRVWDFTQRGEGLRRTTSLLGKAGTGQGPVHWSANFDEIQDFEHDMRGPFGGTGFMSDADFLSGDRARPLGGRKAGLSPDLDALAAYVSSLNSAHPSPYRNSDGTLTAEGLAGRDVFQRADVGCARCHSGPAFTDSRLPGAASEPAAGPLLAGDFLTAEGFLVHDVGTLSSGTGKHLGDTLKGLDTPTLKGAWEFPPYLHDGSAATLMEVITTANPSDRHGRTSHLSSLELTRLAAYLEQIDETEAGTAAVRQATRSVSPRPHGGAYFRGGMVFRGDDGALDRTSVPLDARGRRLSEPRAAPSKR